MFWGDYVLLKPVGSLPLTAVAPMFYTYPARKFYGCQEEIKIFSTSQSKATCTQKPKYWLYTLILDTQFILVYIHSYCTAIFESIWVSENKYKSNLMSAIWQINKTINLLFLLAASFPQPVLGLLTHRRLQKNCTTINPQYHPNNKKIKAKGSIKGD